MPIRKGTGPNGMGPLTGWGMGICGGGTAAGRGTGRRMGIDPGSRMGFGRWGTPLDLSGISWNTEILKLREKQLEAALAETRDLLASGSEKEDN